MSSVRATVECPSLPETILGLTPELEGQGGVGMAQPMQRDAGQSCITKMSLEGLADAMRIEWLTLLGREDVAALAPVLRKRSVHRPGRRRGP